jgi:ABC transport system ATP-binding/permease protein
VPLLDATGLHKAYGARTVLRSVDVTIRTGERVGVVGQNGAGKSTLARILAGLEVPDGGVLSRRRGTTVLYLEQVPRFAGDPTVEHAASSGLSAWSDAVARHEAASRALSAGESDRDSLLLEQQEAAEAVERFGGWQQRHRVAAILDKLGVGRLDARISTLSGGEQRRVALARLLVAEPDLAVLDEPTNHLDAETIEGLEKHWLEESSGALLLITHDRYLLDRVATRTLEVSDGQVFSYEGGYELYLEQKAERAAHAARAERNRQNLLRRELEWLRRQPKARTTKQKARVDRAQSALATDAPREERQASFALEVVRSGKTILEARGLTVAAGGNVLIRGFDLFVTAGERIGIVGRNGTGKTTLLRTLLGDHPATEGSVTVGKNTQVAYFDQLRGGLEEDRTVLENVIGDQTRIELGGRVVEPHAYLERFGLDGSLTRQRVGSLSGGERARVALARLMRRSTNLLVLDEPTNDLDVDTLSALEDMLVEFGVTALVVTHDRWFLDRVATAILAFEGDGRVVRYPGNHDTYLRLRAEARALASATVPPGPARPGPARAPASRKRGLTFAEDRELAQLPDAIEAAEAQVTALTAELADPATYATRGADVARLTGELEAARGDVDRLTERWEALETKKSG